MDSVLENNYIFEIDCLQTIKGLGGREVSNPMKPHVVLLLSAISAFNVKYFCLISLAMLILAEAVTKCIVCCKSVGQI